MAARCERRDALADHLVATRLDGGGRTATVVVDTRDHAATLNSAIRDRLVAAGAVDDRRVAVTHDGQRLGAGDVIVTRRNDPDLGVANRETWTVTRVHRDGRLTVDDSGRGGRELPADYVRGHVELGYAVTGYGAQGDTTTEAHLVLTETTTAAAGYVAMTRGRASNTAHLVAADLDDAREQWIAAFGRDRADLGPAAAGQAAARAAAGYRTPRPLSEVLADLRTAWTDQLTAHRQLERLQERLDHVQAQAGWEAHCQQVLAPFETAREAAGTALERADQASTGCAAILTERAEHHAAALRQTWDTQLVHAEHAARTIAAGPGRLGIHRGRVRNAQQHLDTWTATWSPVFAGSDLDPRQIAARPIVFGSHVQRVTDALDEHARRLAAADHPDEAARLHAAQQARDRYDAAAAAYHQTRHNLQQRSHLPVYHTGAASQLPELTERVEARAAPRPIRRPADRAAHHRPGDHQPPQPAGAAPARPHRLGHRAGSRPPARGVPNIQPSPVDSGTTRPRSTTSTTAHPSDANPHRHRTVPRSQQESPTATPSTRRHTESSRTVQRRDPPGLQVAPAAPSNRRPTDRSAPMIIDRHHESVTIPDQAFPNARPRTPVSVKQETPAHVAFRHDATTYPQ